MTKLNTIQFFYKELTKLFGHSYEYQSLQDARQEMTDMASDIKALAEEANYKANSSLK